MSKIMSLVRRAPKRFSAVAVIVAAAIIVPAAVFAWGPSRPTFTMGSPAPYVTFNSITDNDKVGDERNFLRIRETGTTNYVDNVTLTPGKVYDVSAYYHNNAATNLNASGAGIAHGATLKMEIPGVVTAGVNAAFTGTISASNSNPGSVWDEAYGKNTTNADIALRYVSNSATFVSNGAVNGQKLPDTLFTTGASLGYYSQNGELPGCDEYSGYVNFQIRVDQPNFTVKKQVSVDAGKTWVDDSVKATAGSTIQYRVVYQNTGSTQQDSVSVRDILPTGVSYVAGSSLIANSTTGGQYKTTVDGVTTTGYNAGSYQPQGNAFLKFSATLPSEDQLKCGTNTLVNTARVTTNAGYKEDTATVTIDKKCLPTVKYTCDALKVDQIDRTNFKFTTNYTAENATFKNVTYVVKNANGAVISTQTSTSNTLNYTQATAGSYTVQATVTFTVDGYDKTATNEACKGSFKVTELPKEISVCELATKQIITIKESDFDSSKHSKNLADCKEIVKKIKVCDLTSKQIVVINEGDFDTSKYSKNLDDCKENPPVKVCDLTSKTIVTINESDFDATKYTKDLSKCETTVTPPELPHTGAGENIVAIFGLGALIASAAYYIASRRALNQ
ncbi:MAG: LPXTG cell wall anchor domain-containing protein [Candidatus Saccharimonadaceae bacterium]